MPSTAGLRRDFNRTPRPGRRGRPEKFYAEVAATYAAHLRDPTPLKSTAAKLGIPEKTVRHFLAQARDRGLLTKAPRGRAGGQLTEKGRKLLDGTR